MRVLITGATGLLGSHLCEAGSHRGVELVALSRAVPERSYLGAHPGSARHVPCDIGSAASPDPNLFDGVDAVIHAAGLASSKPEDHARMQELNVGATQRVYEAARRAAVPRFVHVSSIATLSGTAGLVTEAGAGHPRPTAYAATKLQAEQWLLSQRGGPALTLIHPSYLLGAWDAKPSSGAVLFALRLKVLRHYVDVVKNFVAARDVAHGIWEALEKGAEGRFLLAGENLRLSDFFELALAELGMSHRLVAVPHATDERLGPREREWCGEFCTPSEASSARAETLLGYRAPTGVAEALAETVRYFIEWGLLKRGPAAGGAPKSP